MGHALHSYYSCHNQPVNTSDYVIFVAEVASTCNEVLLMRYLLSRTQDKKERAYLINHFLDQFKGTVYRQTMFAEFELEMGRMSEAGQALTADVLCEKYKALNELYYGPDMVCDEGIALEWARIPAGRCVGGKTRVNKSYCAFICRVLQIKVKAAQLSHQKHTLVYYCSA